MKYKLGDLCTFYTGTGFPEIYQGNKNGEIAFFKVGDIARNVQEGKLYLDKCNNYISKDIAKVIKGCLIPANTIVFAKIGEALKLNRRALTENTCLIDNNIMGIKPKDTNVDVMYLYYFMLHLKMEQLAQSTTVPSVRKSTIENVNINLPNRKEQLKIVEKLDSISSIIKLHNNELLELDILTKSRFVEMFFDVKDNIKTNNVKCIKEFANLLAGATPSTRIREYWENGDIPWMSSGEVHQGRILKTEKMITQLGYDKCSTKMVPAHTVLIALAGQGKTRGTVAITDIRLCTNQSLCSVVTDETVLSDYLYHNLKNRYEEIRNMCAITDGRGGLNLKIVGNIKVVVPPVEEQKQFILLANQVDKLKFMKLKGVCS